MQQYRVKNWERFQHYKDRNPPWIKLHYEIMTSSDWVMLADASKLLAVVCMLIASRNAGMVPADPAYFRRVAYLDKLPNFKPLLECGFLEKLQAEDSGSKQPQADATTEGACTETETEEDKKPLPGGSVKKAPRSLPADWSLPQEWGEWAETEGMAGDDILRESSKFKDYWLGNGKTKVDWEATWRNWIRRCMEAKR